MGDSPAPKRQAFAGRTGRPVFYAVSQASSSLRMLLLLAPE